MSGTKSGPPSTSLSSSSCLQHLQKDLRCLGFAQVPWPFPGCDLCTCLSVEQRLEILTSDEIFAHPNPQYAREVLLFLLACLDCERAKKDFRDCWPILDKKQEADFRRTVLAWYRELSDSNPDLFPFANPALLQTPGGAKFLSFLHKMSSGVIGSILHTKDPDRIVLKLNRNGDAKKQALLFSLAAKKSLKAAGAWDESAAALHDQAALIAQDLAADYRRARDDRAKTEDALSKRCREEQETLMSLEAKVQEMQAERERLAAALAADLDRSLTSLRVISEILADGKEEERTNVLKVDCGGNSNKDFAEEFEELLQMALTQAKYEADVKIPAVPEASLTLDRLTTQLGGLKDKVGKLSSVTLPEAKFRVDKLMTERNQDKDGNGQEEKNEGNEVLPKLSQNPKFEFDKKSTLTSPNKGNKRRFSLLPVRITTHDKNKNEKTSPQVSKSNLKKKNEDSQINLDDFAPSLDVASSSELSSIDYNHQHFSHQFNRHHSSPRKLDSVSSLSRSHHVASHDAHGSLEQASKLSSSASVFSPILSSSRVSHHHDQSSVLSKSSFLDKDLSVRSSPSSVGGASLADLTARVEAIKSRNRSAIVPDESKSNDDHDHDIPQDETNVQVTNVIKSQIHNVRLGCDDTTLSSVCSSPATPPISILKKKNACGGAEGAKQRQQQHMDLAQRLHLESPALDDLDTPNNLVLVGSETPKMPPPQARPVAKARDQIRSSIPSPKDTAPRFKLTMPMSPELENGDRVEVVRRIDNEEEGSDRSPLLDLEQVQKPANAENINKKKMKKGRPSVGTRLNELVNTMMAEQEEDEEELMLENI